MTFPQVIVQGVFIIDVNGTRLPNKPLQYMNPNETPEIKPVDPATPAVGAPVVVTPPADPSQPAKPVQKFTKRERLEFSKAKIEQQLTELDDEEDENRPLTVGDLKKMQQEKSKETAIELAAAIENQDERDAVIEILSTRIVPTDKPEEDVKIARELVTARKNAQIVEDLARKQDPTRHSAAPGAPGNTPNVFTPTPEELVFMQPPYNLTQEEVIKARNKAQQ